MMITTAPPRTKSNDSPYHIPPRLHLGILICPNQNGGKAGATSTHHHHHHAAPLSVSVSVSISISSHLLPTPSLTSRKGRTPSRCEALPFTILHPQCTPSAHYYTPSALHCSLPFPPPFPPSQYHVVPLKAEQTHTQFFQALLVQASATEMSAFRFHQILLCHPLPSLPSGLLSQSGE